MLGGLFLCFGLLCCAQERPDCIMFYNTENFFDTKDDPATADEEYSPEGTKAWTYSRYVKKCDHLARAITAVGGYDLPVVIGLCEVENKAVLFDLVQHRLLKRVHYSLIHRDSPDRRGIDVAVIYDPERFIPLHRDWIRVDLPDDPDFRTREILYVKGVLNSRDTLHLFFNHWPSRWGGVAASRHKRICAARHLRSAVDSIYLADRLPRIIIMGDFNDNPGDSSVFQVLGAKNPGEGKLHNMAFGFQGTLKYRAAWENFDQVIISDAVYRGTKKPWRIPECGALRAGFLLMDDDKYLGEKLFRTYLGPRYIGGFSDHLPVYIRFQDF